MMAKRLDVYLVTNALAQSRARAKALIKAGQVMVNQRVVKKPAYDVGDRDSVALLAEDIGYVSRGGIKLEHALDEFLIDLTGLTCVDIGASTGGFTDCMLQRGARRVYAIDVGCDQLHEKLRTDSRVISYEGINIKQFDLSLITESIDFICVDVSFISLSKIAIVIKALMADHGRAVVLVKPQFEVGKDKISKSGIVKNKQLHVDVLINNIELFKKMYIYVTAIHFSGIKGTKGNIEYLMSLTTSRNNKICFNRQQCEDIVSSAHRHFIVV